MEPFNIKVGFGEKEVTLTILPAEEGYYKVIYYGGILGAVRLENNIDGWEIISQDQYTAGDLPFYKPDLIKDRIDFVLDNNTVNHIGNEIEHYSLDTDELN